MASQLPFSTMVYYGLRVMRPTVPTSYSARYKSPDLGSKAISCRPRTGRLCWNKGDGMTPVLSFSTSLIFHRATWKSPGPHISAHMLRVRIPAATCITKTEPWQRDPTHAQRSKACKWLTASHLPGSESGLAAGPAQGILQPGNTCNSTSPATPVQQSQTSACNAAHPVDRGVARLHWEGVMLEPDETGTTTQPLGLCEARAHML